MRIEIFCFEKRIYSTLIEYNASYYKAENIDILLISSRYAHTRDAWLHHRAEIQRPYSMYFIIWFEVWRMQ